MAFRRWNVGALTLVAEGVIAGSPVRAADGTAMNDR
jgi:hypothetical protein